jgi:hypothetical protein
MAAGLPASSTGGSVAHAQRALDAVSDVRRSLELNVHPVLAVDALFHRLVEAREGAPQAVGA